MEQFRRDIATENAILRNTCENLLKHRAHPEVVARLLDGQSSTDRSALLALESSLRPDNVEVFVHNLEDMCNLIDELYKVYPKDTSNVPVSFYHGQTATVTHRLTSTSAEKIISILRQEDTQKG